MGVRLFFSRLREQPCRRKRMPAELELWGALEALCSQI